MEEREWEQQDTEQLKRIVETYNTYKFTSNEPIKKKLRYINSMDAETKSLLSEYAAHLKNLQKAIEVNHKLAKLIIRDADHIFEDQESRKNEKEVHPTMVDIDKLHSTLKQFARDWSEVGAEERDKCYGPIIREVKSRFPQANKSSVKVLVPGAGLCRLAWELAHEGFSAQGNEFSWFMLLASNFVLNNCSEINKHELYPWIHQSNNHLACADQLEKITFPDVNPSDIPPQVNFSMNAGDFLDCYQTENEFECVASCFFLDCANNVIEFVERIYKILKPGGVWVNLGPLLYHFSDVPGENSIEPPYDLLKQLICRVGFKYLKEDKSVDTNFSQNPHSMLRYNYKSVFFVCEKLPRVSNQFNDRDSNKENVKH